jgi:two-component system sensor histidine kinase ChvG
MPRILAVNVFALALLAGGFFYIDSYRTRVDRRAAGTVRAGLQMVAIMGWILRAARTPSGLLIAAYAKPDRRPHAPLLAHGALVCSTVSRWTRGATIACVDPVGRGLAAPCCALP